MPSKGGLALRGGDSVLRVLEFLCAALILGIFSWFLAYLTKHHQHIPTWMRAVEGISGAAVVYTAFATILTCFLGGLTFFALLAILLDVCFVGGFVAIAVLARGGIHTKDVNSPLGNSKARDAKLQTAAFAVAIIGAFLFLLTAVLAVLLNRHHKKEKKYGPSPSNNYTSGAGKTPFYKRNRNRKATHDTEELGALGGGSALIADEKAHHNKHLSNDIRPSNDTGMTGSTAAAPQTTYGGPTNKYIEPPTQQRNSGYNAYAPQGTGTAHTTAYPTTDTGYSHGHSHGHDHHQPTGVIHDPKPYAEVHGSGFPHTSPESDQYRHGH